jgi:S-adenosylmethionine synthetase
MNYAIELLKERLDLMENAYQKYVVNGGVRPDSSVSIENRDKVEQLKLAIKILTKTKP